MSNNSKVFKVIARQNVSASKLGKLFAEEEVRHGYEALKASGYMDKIDKIIGIDSIKSYTSEDREERRMIYLLEESLGSDAFYSTANCDLKKALCLLLSSADFMTKIDSYASIIKQSDECGIKCHDAHDGWRNEVIN